MGQKQGKQLYGKNKRFWVTLMESETSKELQVYVDRICVTISGENVEVFDHGADNIIAHGKVSHEKV